MKLLINTQALIWMLESDPQLSAKATEHIKNIHNELYVSIASLWEMTIKRSLGKLDIKSSLEEIQSELQRIQITILPVKIIHLKALHTLPYHHRDPFDRLLISQAMAEDFVVISSDGKFPAYSIPVVW